MAGRALRAFAVAGVLSAAAFATPAAAVQVGAAVAHPAVAASHQVAKRAELHVDRAGYVAVTPIDPYQGDTKAIHVAMAGGQELSRGYLRVDTTHLPAHSKLSTLRLTAPAVIGSPIGGANLTVAIPIVEACVTTAPVPAPLTASNAPPYDCAKGSSVGKKIDAGASWMFPLHPLLQYLQHHDSGVALVPIASTPLATWSAAFGIHDMAATVARSLPVLGEPAVTHKPAREAPASSNGAVVHFDGTTTIKSQPPAESAPSYTTSPPVIAGPQTRLAAASNEDHKVLDAWPWVLALCFLIAIGAIGLAYRTFIGQELQRQVPTFVATIRTHPRAYGVASAAIAWGLVFTGYAVANNDNDNAMPRSYTDGAVPGVAPSDGGQATQQPIAGGPTDAAGDGVHPGGSATAPAGHDGGVALPTTNPTKSEFTGKGHWRTISGTRVFFPADGGVPTADLYKGAADRIGITDKSITLCAHAATTYGPAFNIGAKDLNVYWEWLNDHGGIYGRKVAMSYQNDNYDPAQAVQAAQKCKDSNPFLLIGGIGFDQIPAVRQWAEQNKELYLYHDAVLKGSQGLKYSFTALPSVEQLGRMFGELDLRQFKGKKVGILYRQSPNWEPGSSAFAQVVKAGGGQIVAALPVQNNQANYVQDLVQLRSKGAQVVFAWENALATVEMLKQSQSLGWHPDWLVFPFNLETNTLGQSAFSQPLWGVATWDAYDPFDHGGTFKPYAAQMTEFEKQYQQYDPNAHLSGDGGDLLYLNWEGQAFLSYLLQKCGPDCTRNRLAGMLLAGFSYTTPPACPINFDTGDHHHGGATVNIFKVIRDPHNRPNWAPVRRCVTSY
ncbi:MAG TPA: ABC transporter substrate-binding protein [Mycobacteriales bacterium]|nr:ABC transporter substrate-binding protein [Mycobacteriales bacterium]